MSHKRTPLIERLELFRQSIASGLNNYSIVQEADEDDSQELPLPDTEEMPGVNPTAPAENEAPSAEDIPDNEQGTFISDNRLAMYANTLLKAYQAKPQGQIPQELLTVTTQNANEVISWVEQQLTIDEEPTNQLEDALNDVKG